MSDEQIIEGDQKLTKVKGRKGKKEKNGEGKKTKSKKNGEAEAETTAEGGGEIKRVTLTDSQKNKLRKEVKERRDQVENSCFDFADSVYMVYDAAAYIDWSGPVSVETDDGKIKTENRQYKSFAEYVVNELGISNRTADYFISMSRWFGVDLKDSPEVKEKVKKLGWSKVKELVDVVTAENVDEWVEKAEHMTVAQLAKACQAALNPDSGDSGTSNIKRKSFTLMDDQIEVVEQALAHAGEVGNTDKDGMRLMLVCQDYLASSVRPPAGKSAQSAYLKRMEGILGLKLIAVDAEAKAVVFGKQTFSSLATEGEEK